MGAVRRFLPSALCLTVLFGQPAASARAEVLDIAPDGAVTVYDEPAQIVGRTVIPVVARRPPAAASATPAKYRRAAADAKLAPALVEAVAWVESRGSATARSPKGAIGAMQLMPATAAALHVNAYDAEQNLTGGAAYLEAMMARFDGDLERALAAYNAGPAAVAAYRGVPPYAETKAYVAAVMRRLADAASTGAPQ